MPVCKILFRKKLLLGYQANDALNDLDLALKLDLYDTITLIIQCSSSERHMLDSQYYHLFEPKQQVYNANSQFTTSGKRKRIQRKV